MCITLCKPLSGDINQLPRNRVDPYQMWSRIRSNCSEGHFSLSQVTFVGRPTLSSGGELISIKQTHYFLNQASCLRSFPVKAAEAGNADQHPDRTQWPHRGSWLRAASRHGPWCDHRGRACRYARMMSAERGWGLVGEVVPRESCLRGRARSPIKQQTAPHSKTSGHRCSGGGEEHIDGQ
jgi:hypothetical protein